MACTGITVLLNCHFLFIRLKVKQMWLICLNEFQMLFRVYLLILNFAFLPVSPKQVSEHLLCHAIIGKANGKERIIRAQIRADFISPVLQLSKDRIHFRVDKRPDDVTALTPQTRTFVAKNVSSLPLTCVLRVKYPFQVLHDHQEILKKNIAV